MNFYSHKIKVAEKLISQKLIIINCFKLLLSGTLCLSLPVYKSDCMDVEKTTDFVHVLVNPF